MTHYSIGKYIPLHSSQFIILDSKGERVPLFIQQCCYKPTDTVAPEQMHSLEYVPMGTYQEQERLLTFSWRSALRSSLAACSSP